MKEVLLAMADRNETVEDLQKRDASLGGKTFLNIQTMEIVRIEEETPKAESETKKKKK